MRQASRTERTIAVVMLVVALAYLVPFVSQGWIPFDEGMLGQSAERVLGGEVPHVAYQEPYTGGLSWVYAAVFKVVGIDLVYLRWLLFAGAVVSVALMYLVLRRRLQPVAAALATWIGLAWSFPNYFAPLPSWWLLVCALVSLWALIRHVETERWRYAAVAGLSAGVAIAIKQTGVYLLVAVVLSLLYPADPAGPSPSWRQRGERLVRWGLAAAAIAAAAVILAPRLLGAESVYLFCPAAACAVLLLVPPPPTAAARTAPSSAVIVIAAAAAAVPLALLVVPYVARHQLWDFVNGALLLPRKRLDFASYPMAPPLVIVLGLPLLALVLPVPKSIAGSRSRLFEALLWVAAVALPTFALWYFAAYQLIWQSTRAFAAILPVAICCWLASGHVQDPGRRRMLFAAASMLAWASLNQFPAPGPIYFSYVTPLAVIAGVFLGRDGSGLPRQTVLPWTLLVLLFAVLSSHRTYVTTLGLLHRPSRFDTQLDLPRAHLRVSAHDAQIYWRVASLIKTHLRGGELVAGPDCPEVYFLSGRMSPSGVLFEAFSDDAGLAHDEAAGWSNVDVIVVNHLRLFSPAVSDALISSLRREFPHGEDAGRFEVRWR